MEYDKQAALEINKLHTRLPLWKKNPQQFNSTILRIFLELVDKNGLAERKILKREFLLRTDPANDFYGNFAQMCNFGERNHGKVFELVGDKVKLWEPIANYVKELFC
ncbi:MAG: hypothetical protein LBR23_02950 [Spirochaetaceae bacterium]|jgi:hypothetical protein|nr:hypothetical protein [Spirochaetaceae bacterium]